MNSLLQTIYQKEQMTQPWSVIVRYGYDTDDNQASVTEPNGNITQGKDLGSKLNYTLYSIEGTG